MPLPGAVEIYTTLSSVGAAARLMIGELLPLIAVPLKSRLGGRLPAGMPKRLTYHPPCSLQHGQKVVDAPRRLLEAAGFTVVEPREPHLCCGSAGTYSLLQPELSNQLRDRKAGHINERRPDVVASGNIGCMHHLAPALDAPVVHTVELLDWAAGGPRPGAMGRG